MDQGGFASLSLCTEDLHEHPTVGNSFEGSVLVLVELRLPINLSYPTGIYVQASYAPALESNMQTCRL
jgi:hypothetical protein